VPILLGVFFLSGLAGLLWEVVWVRDFGLTFGNTIYSASFVTGVLMAGLGIGAWLGGVIADRRYRKDRASGVRYYVLAEVGIALLGTAIAFILPRLEACRRTRRSPPGGTCSRPDRMSCATSSRPPCSARSRS
jgi:MFS family permease